MTIYTFINGKQYDDQRNAPGNFSNLKLKTQDLNTIITYLENHPDITELNLSSNQIDKIYDAFIIAVLNHEALQKVNIHNNASIRIEQITESVEEYDKTGYNIIGYSKVVRDNIQQIPIPNDDQYKLQEALKLKLSLQYLSELSNQDFTQLSEAHLEEAENMLQIFENINLDDLPNHKIIQQAKLFMKSTEYNDLKNTLHEWRNPSETIADTETIKQDLLEECVALKEQLAETKEYLQNASSDATLNTLSRYANSIMELHAAMGNVKNKDAIRMLGGIYHEIEMLTRTSPILSPTEKRKFIHGLKDNIPEDIIKSSKKKITWGNVEERIIPNPIHEWKTLLLKITDGVDTRWGIKAASLDDLKQKITEINSLEGLRFYAKQLANKIAWKGGVIGNALAKAYHKNTDYEKVTTVLKTMITALKLKTSDMPEQSLKAKVDEIKVKNQGVLTSEHQEKIVKKI